jgi:hypothetical protein
MISQAQLGMHASICKIASFGDLCNGDELGGGGTGRLCFSCVTRCLGLYCFHSFVSCRVGAWRVVLWLPPSMSYCSTYLVS